MQNFQDTFETRKRSLINALSVCMTVPLNCSVISVTCYVNLYQRSEKNRSHVNTENKDPILRYPQKVFLTMYCIRYQSSHVVFYLRDKCELFLMTLYRDRKHAI